MADAPAGFGWCATERRLLTLCESEPYSVARCRDEFEACEPTKDPVTDAGEYILGVNGPS